MSNAMALYKALRLNRKPQTITKAKLIIIRKGKARPKKTMGQKSLGLIIVEAYEPNSKTMASTLNENTIFFKNFIKIIYS
jgi:hypothetical protein